MMPIEEFAKTKNLTTEQVMEGIKAGIYDFDNVEGQLVVGTKENQAATSDVKVPKVTNMETDATTRGLAIGVGVLLIALIAVILFIYFQTEEKTKINVARGYEINSYSRVYMNKFVDSCIAMGGTRSQCQCSLNEFQKRLTQDEAITLDLALISGAGLNNEQNEVMASIMKKCVL